MELKEFYQKFGREYPLPVVITAYQYTKQGHEPITSLGTASILYAAKKENRKLYHVGYAPMSGKKTATIEIYKIETETINGLTRVNLEDYLNSERLATTRLGESCCCTLVMQAEICQGSVWGMYTYNNRYAAIVELNCGNIELINAIYSKLKTTADVLAKNALAWYPAYTMKLKEYGIRRYNEDLKNNWIEFFLACNIRFVPHLNMTCEYTSKLSGNTAIKDYLYDVKKEIDLDVKIKDIKVFGL